MGVAGGGWGGVGWGWLDSQVIVVLVVEGVGWCPELICALTL